MGDELNITGFDQLGDAVLSIDSYLAEPFDKDSIQDKVSDLLCNVETDACFFLASVGDVKYLFDEDDLFEDITMMDMFKDSIKGIFSRE